MPSINDSRNVIVSTIPSIAGSTVELWETLTIGDVEKIRAMKDDGEKAFHTLFCLLKTWNLEEELTMENVKKISMDDYIALLSVTSYGKDIEKSLEKKEEENVEKKTD